MLNLLGLFQSKEYLSVDFSGSAVKVARASIQDNALSLSLTDKQAVRDMDDANKVAKYTEALREIKTRNSISNRENVVFSLPTNSVIVRHVELPSMPNQRLSEVIKYEAESHIPFPIEDVILDYHVLEQTDEGTRVLLVVVKNEKLEKYLEVLRNVELRPELVDISAFSLFNLYQKLKPRVGDDEESSPKVLVDIGHDNTDIIIFRDETLYYARSASVAGRSMTEAISEELDVGLDEAENLKIDYGNVPLADSAREAAEVPEAPAGSSETTGEPDQPPAPPGEEPPEGTGEEESDDASSSPSDPGDKQDTETLSIDAAEPESESTEDPSGLPPEESEEEPPEDLESPPPSPPESDSGDDPAGDEASVQEPPSPPDSSGTEPDDRAEASGDDEDLSMGPPDKTEPPPQPPSPSQADEASDEQSFRRPDFLDEESDAGSGESAPVDEPPEESTEDRESPPEAPSDEFNPGARPPEGDEPSDSGTDDSAEPEDESPGDSAPDLTLDSGPADTPQEQEESPRDDIGPDVSEEGGISAGEPSGERLGEADSEETLDTAGSPEDTLGDSSSEEGSLDLPEVDPGEGSGDSEDRPDREKPPSEQKQEESSTGPSADEEEQSDSSDEPPAISDRTDEDTSDDEVEESSGGAKDAGPPEEEADDEESDEDRDDEDLPLGELRTPEDEEDDDEGSDFPGMGAAANPGSGDPPPADFDEEQLRSAIQAQVDRLINELQQTFDYFQNEMDGDDVEEIILCGSGCKLKNLPAYVENELSRETHRFDPLAKLKGLGVEDLQSMLVVAGLQLRSVPSDSTLAINLLPREIVRRREAKTRNQKLIANGVLAGVFVLQLLVWLFYSYRVRKNHFIMSKNQLDKVQPIVKRVEELNSTQEKLQKRIAIIDDLEKQQGRILPILQKLSQFPGDLEQRTWYESLSVSEAQPHHKLSLDGITGDFQDTSKLYGWFENLDFVQSVKDHNQGRTTYQMNGQQRSMVRFSLQSSINFNPTDDSSDTGPSS